MLTHVVTRQMVQDGDPNRRSCEQSEAIGVNIKFDLHNRWASPRCIATHAVSLFRLPACVSLRCNRMRLAKPGKVPKTHKMRDKQVSRHRPPCPTQHMSYMSHPDCAPVSASGATATTTTKPGLMHCRSCAGRASGPECGCVCGRMCGPL